MTKTYNDWTNTINGLLDADTATVTAGQVAREGLPAGATAITWTDTGWTECRTHIEDPSWAMTIGNNCPATGTVHFDDVPCDACA